MSSEWTMGKDANGAAATDVIGLRIFLRCGRFVAAAAPLALAALTAAWLFLGATPVRVAVLWCSLGLLATCVVVLGVAVGRAGGRSRRETYAWGVRIASTTRVCGEGTVPLHVSGTRWLSARFVGVMVAVPAMLALWVTLAVVDALGTGTSAVLAEAGAVIEQRPIVKIENEVADSRHSTADATADFTVLLPSGTGGGVPARFEATTNFRRNVGSDLYVAYVPTHPELGAIGDDQREDVERQLAGRAVQFGDAWTIGGFWALVTLAPLGYWWKNEISRRPKRTVGPDWKALRVTVTGTGRHTDVPPPGSPEASDEKKRREKTRTLRCLVVEGGGRQVPFHSQMDAEAAGTVLAGAHGWLLWHPQQRRGRDVLAQLVGDDGWQLPGAVPVQVAEQAEEAGVMAPAQPDPERRVQTLDLGAGWLVTASAPVVVGLAVALGCLTALLLVPDSGAWRLWTAAAGVLTPLVGFIAQGVARMNHGDGDAAG
ncbi:hypothetical protein [Streptomyces canus]|uniref:hypothetical protein n=1 Tax=Streptomyces canus TaxID=58343 RepID=UPI0027844176|nr:hypothetical protein [Streptomyces canus]MDQ1067242.1 hypothetical protein [Streptomyces canus]